MKIPKKIFTALILILIYANYFVDYVECAPKSFVDECIYENSRIE